MSTNGATAEQRARQQAISTAKAKVTAAAINVADSFLRMSKAEVRLSQAATEAQEAGVSPEGVDEAFKLAAKDNPERMKALMGFVKMGQTQQHAQVQSQGLAPCHSCSGAGQVGGVPCIRCAGRGTVEVPAAP